MEQRCPICNGKVFFHVDDQSLTRYEVRNLRKDDNLFTPTGRMAFVCKSCKIKFLLGDGKVENVEQKECLICKEPLVRAHGSWWENGRYGFSERGIDISSGYVCEKCRVFFRYGGIIDKATEKSDDTKV